MNKTSLKNTTDVDFGRETWFKFLLKDLFLVLCEWFRLGDRSIQVEDSTKRPLGLSKGQPHCFIEVTSQKRWNLQWLRRKFSGVLQPTA